ncbi:ATP-binding protein [Rhodococcus sp. IEGM 1379]|uniref:ATP-binding protein n=1 Tax=Rhodococcus sp. IEGM 1379 TaxID=3047086 RepID=UPI0024B7717B|nr:ATP-binding protein [Rhodococcus sp. IEGM 1379]MDI9917033.1 ATP-binding protein [Rhodococcus sp. IEGM 1379]
MAHLSAIEPEQDQTQPVVELRIRATPDQLSILRALAATVAIQENFDLDTIADIRLAMDEVCTHLIVRALPDSVLVCRFVFTAPQLHVSVSTTTADYDGGDQRSFGWHILTALTDSISLDQEADPNGSGYITTMEFTKADGRRP